MSILPVDTPTQSAMRRFCVTARTNRPRRVLFRISHTANTTKSAKNTITMRL